MKIGSNNNNFADFTINISTAANHYNSKDFTTNKKTVSMDSFKISKESSFFSEITKDLEKNKIQKPKTDPDILALKIAIRIMGGDKVPKEDEKFLMEHNPGLYLKAKMMAAQKKNPEEYESLLEEDEGGENSDATGANQSSASESSGNSGSFTASSSNLVNSVTDSSAE